VTIATIEPDLALLRFIARRLSFASGGRFEVDDLSQEGAIGWLMAMPRYRAGNGATARTWCTRRARGAMLDYMRLASARARSLDMREHAARAVAAEDQPDPVDLLRDREPEALRRAIARQALDRVSRNCAHLPARTRAAMRLYGEGWTLREIGWASGLSESRICLLIRDARAAIWSDRSAALSTKGGREKKPERVTR